MPERVREVDREKVLDRRRIGKIVSCDIVVKCGKGELVVGHCVPEEEKRRRRGTSLQSIACHFVLQQHDYSLLSNVTGVRVASPKVSCFD